MALRFTALIAKTSLLLSAKLLPVAFVAYFDNYGVFERAFFHHWSRRDNTTKRAFKIQESQDSIHYTEQEKVFLSEATEHGPGTASATSEMETFNYLTVITYIKINPGPWKKAPL